MSGLMPINMSAALGVLLWHVLRGYDVINPEPAKPFRTRNGSRAAIHINPSNTVYSYKVFQSSAEAEAAAKVKIREIKG